MRLNVKFINLFIFFFFYGMLIYGLVWAFNMTCHRVCQSVYVCFKICECLMNVTILAVSLALVPFTRCFFSVCIQKETEKKGYFHME